MQLAQQTTTATMSETFSRSYLQAMPEKRKQDSIDSYIQHHIKMPIFNAAANNQKSYLFEINKETLRNQNANNILGQNFRGMNVTIDDFILGLQKKFPDCKVNYVEKWVENQNSPYQKSSSLKSGIEIDWS